MTSVTLYRFLSGVVDDRSRAKEQVLLTKWAKILKHLRDSANSAFPWPTLLETASMLFLSISPNYKVVELLKL